ncbi:MAG: acyl-CoA synthetase FdrA [Chloroflexota bacterium]|nr:MAG: acyl-CoA synthetase FdrA [Chloroflexota bacterium]
MIKKSEYHDSVTLMLVARELSNFSGVSDTAVVMGTEANKGLLRNANLLTPEAEAASPNDLVIAVNGNPEALAAALDEAEKLLKKKQADSSSPEFHPKTLRGALRSNPGANVAVISVAGRYAAGEAWEALRSGLHVLLFSDNVSLEDEIALKQFAASQGLLLMGPGAGTAILNGVALGFANAVPAGPVGIVSAAGTGLQEVSTLLARYGVGISQGIGTGGRDLHYEVGGIMMLAGMQALQADPATQVIVLVSKPPAEIVAHKVLAQAAAGSKPVVVCFLGAGKGGQQAVKGTGQTPVYLARTLEEAAILGAKAAQPAGSPQPAALKGAQLPDALRTSFSASQRYLRGLFSGGTLCYEAQVIWRDLLPGPVWSNAPLDPDNCLPDSNQSLGNTAVDLGEEEFTVGRPHPMIDNDLRIRRLHQEGRDPEVAVIMFDVVLGYGAHPDPAAELGPAVREVCQHARENGRDLIMIASITGTSGDPQNLARQVQELEAAGVVVCPSNAAAARLAAQTIANLI